MTKYYIEYVTSSPYTRGSLTWAVRRKPSAQPRGEHRIAYFDVGRGRDEAQLQPVRDLQLEDLAPLGLERRLGRTGWAQFVNKC